MTQPRAVVSGGTGYVGRYIVERLLADGYAVTLPGRTAPEPGYFSRAVTFTRASLDPSNMNVDAFQGAGLFVHAAFDHLPGQYRGGEGDDPEGFRRRNLNGSVAMFEAAARAGAQRVVFLSSRAVYGHQPPGAVLTEELEPRPDTLYGEVKLKAEKRLLELRAPGFIPTVLRVTGVYGAAGRGRAYKWEPLFRDYLSGRVVEPRVATEVHGIDVAAAVALIAEAAAEHVSRQIFNVSDVVLDRRDLLEIVRRTIPSDAALPQRADASGLNIMSTAKLQSLGWSPGGWPQLVSTVAEMTSELRNRLSRP